MTTLIIVRHGQSMANLEGKFAGQRYDAELSPLGHKQAELTAEYVIKNYKVDRVYASDLKRAYLTAVHTADKLGMEVIKAPGMREIYAGKWEGMKFDDIDSKYPKEFREWKTNIGMSSCVGGEKVGELVKRVLAQITQIAEENDGKTVVIATHATPIRAMQCCWEGKSLKEMKDVSWVSNSSVTVAEYESGRFKLVSVSYDKHLGDIKTELPKNV